MACALRPGCRSLSGPKGRSFTSAGTGSNRGWSRSGPLQPHTRTMQPRPAAARTALGQRRLPGVCAGGIRFRPAYRSTVGVLVCRVGRAPAEQARPEAALSRADHVRMGVDTRPRANPPLPVAVDETHVVFIPVVGWCVVRPPHRAALQLDAVRVVEQAVADAVGLVGGLRGRRASRSPATGWRSASRRARRGPRSPRSGHAA